MSYDISLSSLSRLYMIGKNLKNGNSKELVDAITFWIEIENSFAIPIPLGVG